MADKKFLDAMKKKFTEDPTEKRTQFYNMGGWTQSETKSAFVKEGKEIAKKLYDGTIAKYGKPYCSEECYKKDTEGSSLDSMLS